MNLRDRYYWWRLRATDSAPSGPTVIANLNYLTDPGILNMVGAPIENGFYVGTWPWATGGTATSALAIAAGADGGPVYDLTNGVGSDGTGNQALTLPSPVTIPADADCVIYVKANLGALEASMSVLGKTSGAGVGVNIGTGDGETEHTINISFSPTANASIALTSLVATGVYLFRLTRASGVWSAAATGFASAAMTAAGTVSGAVSFDTLLAKTDSGGSLDSFSATTMYIQKIKIWSGTSDPDTAFETANGGAL